MAETPGESFIFIVLAVIFIIVIVATAGYLLLVGVNLSNSGICYVSSEFTNFYYNGLCISNFFCLSSTLKTAGISPPLFGCTTAASAYGPGSTPSQIFSGVAIDTATCWNQYGANQGLTVLPNGPATCGVVDINTNQNLTINNLTSYLEGNAYTTEVSCLNHTAVQSCSDPLSSSNPNGYSCDLSDPSICEAQSSNYFQCSSSAGYSFSSGYSKTYIPLNGSKAPTAALDLTSSLCEASQGCSFNNALGTCATPNGNTNSCTDLYKNFCNGNNCTVGYDSTTKSYEAPPSCTLTEAVKSTSIINESYATYLKPGDNMIFSFKNLSNSSQTKFVDPNSNKSINKAQIYIVYLNSLVGTRFPPSSISLPSECAPATFLNNYPTAGIEYECSRAVVSAVGAKILSPSNPGLIAGVTLAGFAGAECYNNSICKNDVAPNALVYTGKLLYSSLYATGLEQCAQSLFYFFASLPQEIGISKPNFLGRNLIYICAVTK
ncbi:MAG: hypothetical protein M1284_00860 [Candidatus Parvarchaeota archaeon]|nr:hypothetical protein [Candidatus Parvarchaeota archaeon]MCL5420285.1 hypothetical protein [Candidatus Parvarchaeota archaeon]